MQEKLIIFLPAETTVHPSWAVVDAENVIKYHVWQDDPEALALAAQDKEVIVVVPAEDVLLTQASLPKMSRSRLAQALPFALEEQLITEVEHLHFASGANQADGSFPVAVVAKEKLQAWLDQLKSWQVTAHVLTPESLALPVEDKTWHVFINPNTTLAVRTGLNQGFGGDLLNLTELLALNLSGATDQPTHVIMHNYSQQVVDDTQKLPLHVITEQHPVDQLITDIARNITHFPILNLLQGTYVSKKSKFPQKQKIWRIMAGLAAAWLALLFLYPVVSYLILNQRVSHINSEIDKIYLHNFPQATSVVAPKLRMESKLQKLASEIGENRILLLLGHVGKAVAIAPNVKLKRFDFQNNQLTLELTASSSEDISAFSDYLTQQALNVKQENANVTGSRISATLLVE